MAKRGEPDAMETEMENVSQIGQGNLAFNHSAERKQEIFIKWLSDAYAMELQSSELFQRLAERIKNYPELREHIKQRIQECDDQGKKLQIYLSGLGADISPLKTGVAMLWGNMQALISSVSDEEIVKEVTLLYMHEHYKIGAYKVLIATAEECQQPEIVKTCMTICMQEDAMQQWLLNHIGDVTRTYLQRATSE